MNTAALITCFKRLTHCQNMLGVFGGAHGVGRCGGGGGITNLCSFLEKGGIV